MPAILLIRSNVCSADSAIRCRFRSAGTALSDDAGRLLDGLRISFELSLPLTPDRTGAATAGEVSGRRRQMVHQIVEMGVLLEVVATTVGHNSSVDYVHFSHRPAVEARFREKVFQENVTPDLDIACAQTKYLSREFQPAPSPSYSWCNTQATRCDTAVDPWDFKESQAIEVNLLLAVDAKAITMRPVDGLIGVIDPDVKFTEVDVSR